MLKQEIIIVTYNKDVVCTIDKGQSPICNVIARPSRRAVDINYKLPSHDPYIPRANAIIYNCSQIECKDVNLKSLSDVALPKSQIKSCFQQSGDYKCDTIRYNNLKTVDKILFLADHIPNKYFYLVDCLVYKDGGRVCHRKDNVKSHANLVDTGTIARPREPNVLSQNEFICEESEDKQINCDLDLFVPFEDGLRLKESAVGTHKDVLLKTGSYVVLLKLNCIESWCGFSGKVTKTRRYEPPGGKVYRCYYANKQQICKEVENKIYTDW